MTCIDFLRSFILQFQSWRQKQWHFFDNSTAANISGIISSASIYTLSFSDITTHQSQNPCCHLLSSLFPLIHFPPSLLCTPFLMHSCLILVNAPDPDITAKALATKAIQVLLQKHNMNVVAQDLSAVAVQLLRGGRPAHATFKISKPRSETDSGIVPAEIQVQLSYENFFIHM